MSARQKMLQKLDALEKENSFLKQSLNAENDRLERNERLETENQRLVVEAKKHIYDKDTDDLFAAIHDLQKAQDSEHLAQARIKQLEADDIDRINHGANMMCRQILKKINSKDNIGRFGEPMANEIVDRFKKLEESREKDLKIVMDTITEFHSTTNLKQTIRDRINGIEVKVNRKNRI
jgi:hypothetical protein